MLFTILTTNNQLIIEVVKMGKKIFLYLFLLCVAIAIIGGLAILGIMATSGRSDWHIDFANGNPLDLVVGLLGITCAISGLLSGVFMILFIVKK